MNIKNLMVWCGSLFAIIAGIWFTYELVGNLSIFSDLGVSAGGYSFLAIFVYVIPTLISALAWFLLLCSVGENRITLNRAVSICCISQMGKYLPGNVAHHVGRVILSKRYGLGLKLTLFTIFMETIWVIAIAALLALAAILIVGNRLFERIPQIPQWWMLATITITALTFPVIGHGIFEFISRWWSHRRGLEFQSIRLPSINTFILIGFLYILNYLFLGVVLNIIASNVFGVQEGSILLMAGVFAVAWIAGFITPGAPAGIGVREVVLVAALTPIYGKEIAIGIATVLRIVTVLGDGLAFLRPLIEFKLPSSAWL